MIIVSEEKLVEENRGFQPSDIKDPGKKEFLTQLRDEIKKLT